MVGSAKLGRQCVIIRGAIMRPVTYILLVLLALLQYPLWFGKGGWLKVRELNQQLSIQVENNYKHAQRNAALSAEVRDLKRGTEAIEERARNDLGMVKRDELFFQMLGDTAVAEEALNPVAE